MARTPKGSYSRPTGDFFSLNLCVASGNTNDGTGLSTTLELFNNASDGSALYVLGMVCTVQSEDFVIATIQPGPLNPIQNQGKRITPARATPPGQVGCGPAPSYEYVSNLDYQWQVSNITVPWFPNFPIAIIPPGYSFICYNSRASEQVTTWFYVLLQDY